ncbi:MAG: hypothetical protein KDA24_17105, partial [Deltaproteobacteria bacterium]|nr:hypothetical protein [Deltaproteobacteria bacterium]
MLSGFVTIALFGGPTSAHATVASQLCTGDPCVITGSHSIDDGSLLDFGAASVQLFGTLDLTQPSIGSGSVSIIAGDFSIETSGVLVANGGGQAPGGDVSIVVLGDIALIPQGLAIKTQGNPAGDIVLDAGGSVTGSGALNLTGQGPSTQGGDLTVSAGTDIVLSGLMQGDGTPSGQGGTFTFLAGASASLAGDMELAVGGTAIVEACDVLMTGSITATGTGGLVDVLGLDSLEMTGTYQADSVAAILIEWGPLADPPALGAATFVPGSVQALDPSATCGVVGDDDDSAGDDDDSAGDDDDSATGDDDDSATGDDDDSATGDDDDSATGG